MKAITYTLVLLLILTVTNVTSQETKKIPIPGIYNTGVDNNRLPLGDGEIDLHYVLAVSSDIMFPGPDAKIVSSAGYLMDCCWMKNDSKSKWIAPRTDAIESNTPGPYLYSLSFSLYGFKPETAEIYGFWMSDNNGMDILINTQSTGFTTPYNSFSLGFYPFEIKTGFVEGINTILFEVYNSEAPTGLRVIISGEAVPIDQVFNSP